LEVTLSDKNYLKYFNYPSFDYLGSSFKDTDMES